MKTIINLKGESRMSWFLNSLTMKSLIFTIIFLTGIQASVQSQEAQFTRPSWWVGGAAGANFNFYRGSTQKLNADLTAPVAFHQGNGAGLYLAPLVEFYRPDSRWGIQLQAGYDSRRGSFEEEFSPCNCPRNLSTKLTYFTVEPSLRFAPFKSHFYLFAGPRLAFNIEKSFTYEEGTNPAYPEQVPVPDVKGDLSDVNKTLISMQIGAAYDIPLSSQNRQTQIMLSPFLSFQPYFGQDPRSIETLNITTLRIGAALKFGHGHKTTVPVDAVVLVVDKDVVFTVNSPKNIPVERRVRETFPIRNYVFFNIGSTEIPSRYVLLTQDQVKDFKEDQLEVFTPKKLTGRSAREMTAYYNILNILGDRMGKNPGTTVRLTGASMEGEDDGLAMAETVKQYLVTVFRIDATRINTEGRIKPRIPSEQPGGTKELALLREGDRRVSIWSTSPSLMMEFQSGPDAPLKPVEIVGVQEAPLDSYVSFDIGEANETFSSWSLEVADEKGNMQYFGPYTQQKVSIPGKLILGAKPEGDYKVKMIGKKKNGKTVNKETSVHMVLWTPSKDEEGMRFRILYEFNDSKAIAMYEKYLTDIVTPKIPKNGKVLIHGYTDVIGDPQNNLELSTARANDVKQIIEKALAKAGRTDVRIETYGFGEDEKLAQFENDFPEERFYNRSVVIDIVPQ